MIAFAGIALAGGGKECGDPGEHGGHPNLKMMGKKLGLTDVQKSKAKMIFQGNKEVVKPIIDNLRTERDSLQTLLHADTVDEIAIRTQTAKIAGFESDLNVNRAKMAAQFREILTPEQVTILKAMQKEKPKRQGHRPPQED
jgi:Spy/CpxP family protein refolding chaperone